MKTNIIKNWIIILLFGISLSSCNNGDKKDDRGWFAGEEIDNPTSAEEIGTSLENLLAQADVLNKDEVKEFYQKRDNAPAWNVYDTRQSFLLQLKKADEEGLSFEDYHGKKLEQLLDSEEEKNPALLEILLTDAFFEYAEDLYYGKTDPKKLHEIFGVKRKEIQFPKLLHDAVVNEEIEKTLDGLKPNHQVYKGLKESLREYAELKEKNIAVTTIDEGEVIKPGDKDERITVLVKRLKELGVLDKDYMPKENLYDKKLASIVTDFQDKTGLAEDGVLGNSTIQLLNMDNEDKYNKILINLERWRWYPRDLGEHYILINIPDFKLVVVKDGDTVRTHNVIAGSPTKQTPIFSDSLQYIVINPEWNIPTSIKMNEIIPKASKNPSYLSSHNMYVTNANGEIVDPSSINWSGEEVKSYRIAEKPGAGNSLGRVKIIYPNQYAIYLHDTPAKSIFDQNNRAESHGCVRVENALDLAAYVVEDQKEWSLDRIQKVIGTGQTTQVPISQPIKVHHFYWSAWRENGETIFVKDVYNLDEKVLKALKAKA